MDDRPPPLPPRTPRPLDYRTPDPPPPSTATPQKIFDTVAGPNVRLRDNLIQFAAVIVGALLGAAVGYLAFARPGDAAGPVILGAAVGLFAALILSGAVIGLVRLVTAIRR